MADIPEKAAVTDESVESNDTNTQSDVQQQLELTEKRRRDAQSAYAKEQNRAAALEAELAELKKAVTQSTAMDSLSQAQKDELDELKYSDPDSWKAKLEFLEGEHSKNQQAKLSEAAYQAELARRAQMLREYNSMNPEFQLTEDVLQLDIPNRITGQLEDGKISFDEFLDKASAYLRKGKVIKDEPVHQQPNLSKVGGGSTPSNDGAVVDNYAMEIY